VKSPKIYVADTGIAAHLAGVKSLAVAEEDPLRGPLYETYAAQNLASIVETHWPGARLHYWCVQGRHEVDFVIESGRDCVAVEIKASARWEEKHLRGLQAFVEATPRCRAGILAYTGAGIQSLGGRLWAVPLAVLLG
jgi:hypothetical protein